MKTVGILTHYQVHNHGALLQLYALYHVLQNLHVAPTVLTYQKNFDFLPAGLKNKYEFSLKSLPYYGKYLAKKGLRKTWFNFHKNRILERFKKDNFSFSALEKTPVDYAVVGSDEVFSLEAGLNRMMYGYGVQSKKIFSYAASFGQTNVTEIEQKNCRSLIAEGLNRFSSICVRDRASADTVETLIGKKPAIHFDPVLLYGFQEELKNTVYQVPSRPYLLVYAYDNHMNETAEVKTVQDYARRHGLLIVSPGFYHSWADIHLNASPLELLHVFKYAACVVTDTFHGSVLSILTNRPFAAFVRDMNKNKMDFLLDSLNVRAARMSAWEELPAILSQSWNWENLNSQVVLERQAAMSYLKEALNE